MKQITIREGARRQHRAVALFAVLQCWLKGLDGVVFDRSHLERLLGLKRFKSTRVSWLMDDFKEFFPHQKDYYFASKNESFGSLYVSRKPLDGFLPEGEMADSKRLKLLKSRRLRLAMFSIWQDPREEKVVDEFEAAIPFFADTANYDERLLASYLALLTQGQISPSSIPPLMDTEC